VPAGHIEAPLDAVTGAPGATDRPCAKARPATRLGGEPALPRRISRPTRRPPPARGAARRRAPDQSPATPPFRSSPANLPIPRARRQAPQRRPRGTACGCAMPQLHRRHPPVGGQSRGSSPGTTSLSIPARSQPPTGRRTSTAESSTPSAWRSPRRRSPSTPAANRVRPRRSSRGDDPEHRPRAPTRRNRPRPDAPGPTSSCTPAAVTPEPIHHQIHPQRASRSSTSASTPSGSPQIPRRAQPMRQRARAARTQAITRKGGKTGWPHRIPDDHSDDRTSRCELTNTPATSPPATRHAAPRAADGRPDLPRTTLGVEPARLQRPRLPRSSGDARQLRLPSAAVTVARPRS
jgi:hypothetical protein